VPCFDQAEAKAFDESALADSGHTGDADAARSTRGREEGCQKLRG
jgi:hypothetical protein